MADQRVFTLIGNFQDNITSPLESINTSINSLRRSLSTFSSNKGGFSDVTKSVGSLVSAHKHLANSVKEVKTELTGTLEVLRLYRQEVGKAASANFAFRRSGSGLSKGEAKFWEQSNKDVEAYIRKLEQLQRIQGRRIPTPAQLPSSAPSAVAGVPSGGGGRRGGGGLAAAVGGGVAGQQLGSYMTNAIVAGFRMGVGLMTRPFTAGADAFKERIHDELTDIQSAGGLFAVDLRKNLGMFKNFQEARTAQEAINYRLAKSAAALPGSTAQYVQEAKKVTDTMVGALAKDQKGFMKLGEDFGAKTGDKMDALGVVIQKFTEKAVLLGKGSGGQSRMYGMPQLLEMMVNQEKFSVKSMHKFSVLRGNPMLQAALTDAEDQIAKTGAGTADRLRAIMKVLDEALPNEVIQGMKNSMDGIVEVMKSSFLDPEVGLFGMGRKLKGIAPAVDEFGRYVDSSGKVVGDLSKAAKADLSLFMLLRDSIGGFALPLSELAQILPEIIDPLSNVGKSLVRIRNVAQSFYANFNQYTSEFEALAKEIGGARGLEIKRTAGARGALLSIANLLRGFGAIDMSKYGDVAKKLQADKPDLGAITGDLFKTLFNSDVMKTIGEAVGGLFGSVIKTVGDLMAGATDIASSGPFAEGLKKGWDAAQGSKGISLIFENLFKVIGKALQGLFKAAPMEMTILAALTVGMPLITGAISAGITALFGLLFAKVPNLLSKGANVAKLAKQAAVPVAAAPSTRVAASSRSTGLTTGISNAVFRPVGPRAPKGFENIALPGKAPAITGGVTGPYKAPELRKPPKPTAKPSFGMLSKLKGKGAGVLASSMIALSTEAPSLAKAGKSLVGIVKSVPLLGLAFAGLDFGLRKAGGQDTTTAAGGAVGAAAGGAAGAALGSLVPVPVVGTVVGGVLGSMIGGWLGENIAPFFASLPAKMEAGWATAKSWFLTLPETLGGWLGATATKIKNWLQYELPLIWEKFKADMGRGITNFKNWAGQKLSDPGTWISLGQKLLDGLKMALSLVNIGGLILDWVKRGAEAAKTGATVEAATGTPKEGDRKFVEGLGSYTFKNGGWVKNVASASGSPGKPFGNLIAAANYENKHKPSGSKLGVFNTSETVIPAAGGYGMQDFIETLRSGFNMVVNTYKEAQAKQDSTLKSINATLTNNQQQTNAKFAALTAKMNTPSMPGGLGGGAAGGVDAFTPMAQRMGLTMTSGYRPGDPGWHGANRARDFSNGTGPTPQMMQFAQYLASAYGSNLKELIYTPLGFSIKNGQKVAPYAQGSHYNHVHVAYAMGLGQGVAFNSLSGAQAWEKSMVSGSVKVGSVTGNSAEGFGGGTSVTNNITIHQQPGQDADELASLVAIKIGEAVADARAASIFV